ncbi:MAG: hypothetical protein Q9183_007322 [Haloplaca sp. 2 TL-2023]
MKRLKETYGYSDAAIAGIIFLTRLSSIISILYYTPQAPIPPLREVEDYDITCQLTRKRYTTKAELDQFEKSYLNTCKPLLSSPDFEAEEKKLLQQLHQLMDSLNGMVSLKARHVYDQYKNLEAKAKFEREEEASRRGKRLRKVRSDLSIEEDEAYAAPDRERGLRGHHTEREARHGRLQHRLRPLLYRLKDPVGNMCGRGGYQVPKTGRPDRKSNKNADVEDWMDVVARSGHETAYEVVEPEEEHRFSRGHSVGGKYLTYGEGR